MKTSSRFLGLGLFSFGKLYGRIMGVASLRFKFGQRGPNAGAPEPTKRNGTRQKNAPDLTARLYFNEKVKSLVKYARGITSVFSAGKKGKKDRTLFCLPFCQKWRWMINFHARIKHELRHWIVPLRNFWRNFLEKWPQPKHGDIACGTVILEPYERPFGTFARQLFHHRRNEMEIIVF